MQAHQRNDDERPHDQQDHADRVDEHRQDRAGQVPVAQDRQQRQNHDETDRALRRPPRLDVALHLGGQDGLIVLEGGRDNRARVSLVGRGSTQQPARTHIARRQRVGHARGGVDIRGESRDQRHEDNDVHERANRRDPSHLEDGCESVRLHRIAVPRQQRDQQDDRADIEHEDTGDNRTDRAAHRCARVLGFGCGDRHDLQAAERRDDGQERDRDARQAIGHKPVMSRDVLPHSLVAGHGADDHRARDQVHAHAQERNDRDDLHHRQPGLDLAILTGGQQINAANNDDNNEGHHPLRDRREPADEERRRARHLQARHTATRS